MDHARADRRRNGISVHRLVRQASEKVAHPGCIIRAYEQGAFDLHEITRNQPLPLPQLGDERFMLRPRIAGRYNALPVDDMLGRYDRARAGSLALQALWRWFQRRYDALGLRGAGAKGQKRGSKKNLLHIETFHLHVRNFRYIWWK